MSAGVMQRICTFHLGTQLFGVDVAGVQEVLVDQVITPVPLAPESVVGVVNLRGQIVTAVDLRCRLGLPPRDPDAHLVHVVVRTEEELVSFLVDRAGDVIDVETDAFERPPETLQGAAGELILGAYKLPDTLLLLLDPERAAEPEWDAHPTATHDGGRAPTEREGE